MNLEAFHTPKLLRALNAASRTLYLVTAALAMLVLWLLNAWQNALYSQVTYFVTPNATHTATRRCEAKNRVPDAFEIENFTSLFIENALAHNQHTYKGHLARALAMMDTPSGQYLESKFHQEDILAVYTQYNGLSEVTLERVEITTSDYPFLVVAYYTIHMRFIGLEQTRDVPGAVSFTVLPTARSRVNPYGLLITQFRFVPYEISNDKAPDATPPA